jgi:excisionase family DNA binding protein
LSHENGTDWLNLSAAATLLGVHPSTLRAWADRGDVPTHRTPGQHRRFRRADIEQWVDSRRAAQLTPGQLIVENVLGRTRMQMAEGRLAAEPWYQHFDEVRRRELREAGRAQLRLLLAFLSDEQPAEPGAVPALGAAYERLGRESGLSLAETVTVFLYFRDFLYDSVVEVYQASGQRAAREWAAMHRRIAAFTNSILLALIEAHEAAKTSSKRL